MIPSSDIIAVNLFRICPDLLLTAENDLKQGRDVIPNLTPMSSLSPLSHRYILIDMEISVLTA